MFSLLGSKAVLAWLFALGKRHDGGGGSLPSHNRQGAEREEEQLEPRLNITPTGGPVTFLWALPNLSSTSPNCTPAGGQAFDTQAFWHHSVFKHQHSAEVPTLENSLG